MSDDEKTQTLRDFFRQGKTCQAAADLLGTSKNAIIGFRHRNREALGLSK